jgi:DNA-binding response OmpR family regulator
MKILVIEDEKPLLDSIKSYLKKESYVCEVAQDFDDASQKINVYEYDCVVVDITLPNGNGLDIIRDLKKNGSRAGIIVISAKNSLTDKVTGLEIGADDYITKPFHLAELNARIKSVLRRKNFEGSKEVVFEEIRIDTETLRVFIKNTEIVLTRKEYEMLLYFLSNKGKVLTREAIAEHLWGDNISDADTFDFIYTHVKNLRKKIAQARGSDYVKTVYGVGYTFRKE